jgi:2-polyprenyl-6-methoxyphenol hydroxylase-like FAD-dependent oxidoreductase
MLILKQVGGSLGGLFTGIALRRLGHNVKIFERNPAPLLHNQGAGLVAGEDIQSFLKKYNRTHRPVVIPAKGRQYLDKEGNVIFQEPTNMKMTSWDLIYYLLRANFDGVQSQYCEVPSPVPGDGTVSYEYGHTVKNIRDHRDNVEVVFVGRDGNEASESADLLVGADGPSSTIRKLLSPEVERKYVGYVAWRGTVPESKVSKRTSDTLTEKASFYHSQGVQILAYTIPGTNGTLEVGKRLLNWVWYCNYPEGSSELEELMTDRDGHRHQNTLPVGKMDPRVWEKQKRQARTGLSPQFAELVEKTEEPFIQAITDVISPEFSFFNGKVRLLGDAVAGFRPHTAASTSQAAFDAEKLSELLRGDISETQWVETVRDYAQRVQQKGIDLGNRSQFGQHPLAR